MDYAIREVEAGQAPVASSGSGDIVAAELAGQVLRLEAKQGDRVPEGSVLLVLEALKMEIEVKAPRAGRVAAILVEKDQTVAVGDGLVELD